MISISNVSFSKVCIHVRKVWDLYSLASMSVEPGPTQPPGTGDVGQGPL